MNRAEIISVLQQIVQGKRAIRSDTCRKYIYFGIMSLNQIAKMASCDVQATPPNGKSVNATIPATPTTTKLPNLPPTSSATLLPTTIPTAIPVGHPESVTNPPNIVMLSTQSKITKITETSSKGKEKTIYKNDITLPPTKIPAPIRMENTCSVRKYTSLMKGGLERKTCQKDDTFSSTSTLVNLTEDSGIQMDCSAFEDDVEELNMSQPQRQLSRETIGTTDSFLCLDEAEQQTLRVLQRAVAEMEADVALHSQMLKETQQQQQQQQEEARKIKETVAENMNEDRSTRPANQEPKAQQQQEQAKLEEVASSSRMCEGLESSTARSTPIRERKHVRVEQLLEAEHDIELLQKLLRPDNQLGNPTADALHFDELPQSDSNITDVGEKIIPPLDEDDKPDRSTTQVGFLYSLLNIFCGKGIRKISYPLLFCGMAVGLIFYLRKM